MEHYCTEIASMLPQARRKDLLFSLPFVLKPGLGGTQAGSCRHSRGQRAHVCRISVGRKRAPAYIAYLMSSFSTDALAGQATVLFDIDVLSWLRQRDAKAPGIHISEPREITCYSRDENRKVDFGSRQQLHKYSDPQLGSDLGENLNTFREKAEDDFGVEPVVGALQSSKFDIDNEADVITYRNNLNKIAGTPYNGRDAWELDSVMVGTSVFFDVRKLDEGPINPTHKRFMYFGYRFESLCTNTKDEAVDANSEFCSIIRLRLGNHRILFAGEIDCEWQSSENQSALRNYVELKTMREPRNDRDLQNMYRHRFLKYWIQSYLAGVRTVVLGFRDDRGILRRVEHFPTRSFPHLAKEHLSSARDHKGQGPWEPFVCLNFLNMVLTQVRRTCAQHVGKTVRIRFQPQSKRLVAVVVPDSDFGDRMTLRLRELPSIASGTTVIESETELLGKRKRSSADSQNL